MHGSRKQRAPPQWRWSPPKALSSSQLPHPFMGSRCLQPDKSDFKRLDLWQRNTSNPPNERQLGSIVAYKFGNQWCLNCLLTKISETTALISKHSSWAKNTKISRDTSKGNSLYRMACCRQYVMNANKWFMQMWRDDQIARGAAVIIFQKNTAAWFLRDRVQSLIRGLNVSLCGNWSTVWWKVRQDRSDHRHWLWPVTSFPHPL